MTSLWTRLLAAAAVGCAALGVALFFVWVYLEYAPNPWEHDVETWSIPRGGPETPYVQQILMGASLALAAVAASTSEALVGLRLWAWPYQRARLFRLKFTWVGGVLWFLILGSIVYLFFYEEISELQYIYAPPGSYDSYDYDSYDQGSGNASSYSYGDEPHPHGPPHAGPPLRFNTGFGAPHGPHGPRGHHGPPHFGPGGEAKWVQALSAAARQAGLVAMVPISLLGVPLARSSALWRLAGLSYEEAVEVHRYLGLLAVLLTSFHTLGYLIVWTQPGFESAVGGLVGLYDRLFTPHGVAGLNPWCNNAPQGHFGLTYNPECCGISNLAGLIAWSAGVFIWISSIECVRRSHYLQFIQVHQLHYVFFGFTCAHWSYGLFWMLPSVTFYAADIALRWRGTYTCETATARVHGKAEGKEPTMLTLVLPVPDSAADATLVAPAGGSCPYLQAQQRHGDATPHRPASPSAPTVGDTAPAFAHDPWAGTTCYLRVRGLSPLSQMGGWSHPFTVAGSIGLDTTGAKRALLLHIAPERRWTLRLTRTASKAGDGSDVPMEHVSVVSPLPAPPHLEHIAHKVMAGVPLLLVGAGSGVTPGIALIRMLASRALPAKARVHLIVIVRSMHVAEALDGYMLPASTEGSTGLPWLTTELHLTRAVCAADESAQRTVSTTWTSRALPTEGCPSPQPPRDTTHDFFGGFRLNPAGDGCLQASSSPYHLVAAPNFISGAGLPRTRRSVVTNEIASTLGAFLGFLAVTWPLIGAAADGPAAWSYLPTSISGMGALLLGWVCALAGAWLALFLCEVVAWCSTARMRSRRAACAPLRDELIATRDAWTQQRDAWMRSSSSAVSPASLAAADAHHTPQPNDAARSLIVPLASNGARPCMKARLAAFTEAFTDQGATDIGAPQAKQSVAQSEVLVAAGGPAVLLNSIKETLPPNLRLLELTHPM